MYADTADSENEGDASATRHGSDAANKGQIGGIAQRRGLEPLSSLQPKSADLSRNPENLHPPLPPSNSRHNPRTVTQRNGQKSKQSGTQRRRREANSRRDQGSRGQSSRNLNAHVADAADADAATNADDEADERDHRKTNQSAPLREGFQQVSAVAGSTGSVDRDAETKGQHEHGTDAGVKGSIQGKPAIIPNRDGKGQANNVGDDAKSPANRHEMSEQSTRALNFVLDAAEAQMANELTDNRAENGRRDNNPVRPYPKLVAGTTEADEAVVVEMSPE